MIDYIGSEKNPRLESIVKFTINSKKFDELFSAIGLSLVDYGYADELVNQGLRKKSKYAPKSDITKSLSKISLPVDFRAFFRQVPWKKPRAL